MHNITVFTLPVGVKKRKEAVFTEIAGICPDNDYSSVLYLAPNTSVLSEVKNAFYPFVKRRMNASAYIPFQATTIRQFTADLMETHTERRVVSDRMRTLVMCEVLEEDNIGYARLMCELLKKIRHYLPDTDLHSLREDTESLITEEKAAARAGRAIDTLKAYEEELAGKSVIDGEGVLTHSIPLIREHVAPGVLVIDGFFDPTPLELDIISALVEKAERVYVLAEENSDMQKYCFSNYRDVASRKLRCSGKRDNVRYYSWPSLEDEVEGIAKNIKKLVFDGMRPWEITVCFPVMHAYLPMLRRVFMKYDIPVSAWEYNMSASGPAVVLDDLITCMEDDYPRSDFLSVLTAPFFPGVPAIVREHAVNYSYRAGIVKGKQSWLSLAEILLQSQGQGDGEDNGRLEEFQRGLASIIGMIEELKRKTDVRSFTDAFESVIDKLGFFDYLQDAEHVPDGEAVSARIGRQLTELRRFAGLYESGVRSSGNPLFFLKYMLRDLKGSDENRDGVKVVDYETAAGIESGILFFGGIREGDFPSRPEIDPILPEKVKKSLGIPHLEYYLNRQKLYFHRLLNASAREPYFSCPAADGDKVYLPSPFLEWGETMKPRPLNIFSEEEVQVRQGAAKRTAPEAGIFSAGKGSGARLSRELTGGFLSVTDIDYYRKCPLRFYIEKVLCLEMDVPPKFEVEHRLWGSLAHKTMEDLFREGDVEPSEMDERIFSCLEKSLKRFPVGEFWSGVAQEIFRKLLPALKDQEGQIRTEGFSPSVVEKKVRAELGGLRLRGKIDRVDMSMKAAGREGRIVRLLDYKTGSVDRDSLQLPLYAGMWLRASRENVERTGYYSLKDGSVSWYPKGNTDMEQFIQDAVEYAVSLVEGMKKGSFPAEPAADSECRYCCHSPLCER